MKISIYVDQQSVDLRLFDFLRASLQLTHKDITVDYHKDADILKYADKKILFSSMPSSFDYDPDQFDLVLFSNSDESTNVATECLIENLKHPNAYLLANAWLHHKHELHTKVLSCNNDFLICRQYWTNAFFPQYHTHQLTKYPRVNDFVFVNGANRSWRHHVIEEIIKQTPSLRCHSVWNTVINETKDAPWESHEDTVFREYVNTQYAITRNVPNSYYDDSISIQIPPTAVGLPQGECVIPPGYFILDHYYQSRCIIFPESIWTNHEASPTEKIAKCFFARVLPWPVGGAKINQIYNSLGFKTAWNLLPADLQQYDDENNHITRHHKMSLAIAYLVKRPEILRSQACQQILDQNYVQFLCNDIDARSVASLKKLLFDQ